MANQVTFLTTQLEIPLNVDMVELVRKIREEEFC